MGKRTAFVLICVAAVMLGAAPAAMAISLSGIDPGSAHAGTTVTCTVSGSFGAFLAGTPAFALVNGAEVISGTTNTYDAASASVEFAIPDTATDGGWDLRVTQTFIFLIPPVQTATLANAFLVFLPYPVITSLNPPNVVAGGGDLTLTVYGKYFTPASLTGSVVRFNGVAAASTTFNSSTVLTAVISAAAVAAPGTAQVTVYNPPFLLFPSRLSNQFPFTVTAPTASISALDPTSAVVGGPAFNLGVTGTGFVTGAAGAVVRWSGVDLATTRDSATHLTAAVPASAIAAAGSATITVRNGVPPGSPISNALPFTVGSGPALSSISPTQVWAGYVKNDLVLTVNGSNFVSGAHIFISGGEKTGTSFVSASQLTVPLVAADIATPGSLTVSVKNPPFPPGTSSAGALPLVVAAETTDPAVTIGGADSAWHNAPVALTFSATDSQSGVQKVQYQSPPTVAAWTDGASYTVPVTTQGAITVSAQALDWCNRVGTAGATIHIDTTKPATNALNAVSVKKGKTATLKFRITEPTNLSPTADVVIEIKSARGTSPVATITVDNATMNAKQTASVKASFKKGAYKWYVYATDLAGNAQDNIAKASFNVK